MAEFVDMDIPVRRIGKGSLSTAGSLAPPAAKVSINTILEQSL